jgi:hypothetical protein
MPGFFTFCAYSFRDAEMGARPGKAIACVIFLACPDPAEH